MADAAGGRRARLSNLASAGANAMRSRTSRGRITHISCVGAGANHLVGGGDQILSL